MKAIVTVKLPRDPKHNPQNKKTGVCPISGNVGKLIWCTDTTGSHHSYVESGFSVEEIKRNIKKKAFRHITRIEYFDED